MPKKYIISCKSRRKDNWDSFIIILALVNAFMLPLDMAFQPSFTQSNFYKFGDFLIDLCFLVDMILMCITSVRDQAGREVFDSFLITVRYVKTLRFVCDLGALLGTGVITNYVPEFVFLGYLKLTRVLRLTYLLQRSNLTMQVKITLNLMKLLLYLLLFFHILCCLLWMVVDINSSGMDPESGKSLQWFPPLFWMNYGDSDFFDAGKSPIQRYLLCFYHAVLIIGSNELGPVNVEEIVFMTCSILLANFINA